MVYPRIRALREDRNLLQKGIAQILHCSQIAYSHYELGKRDIPSEVPVILAAFYNTSTDYLLGVTDVSQAYPPSKKR